MCWGGKGFRVLVFFIAAVATGCDEGRSDHLIRVDNHSFVSADEFDYALSKARSQDPLVSRQTVLDLLADQIIKRMLLSEAGIDTSAHFRQMVRRARVDLINRIVREETFVNVHITPRVLDNVRANLNYAVEAILLVKLYDIDRPQSRDSARMAIHAIAKGGLTSFNFETMVREHSDIRDDRNGQGSLVPQYIVYGQSGFTMESEIFARQVGQFTSPIEVPGAFVIAKIIRRRPNPAPADIRPPSEAELHRDIRERFIREYAETIQASEDRFIDSLMSTMHVRIQSDALAVVSAKTLHQDTSSLSLDLAIVHLAPDSLTVRDFLTDYGKMTFVNEDHLRSTLDRWVRRHALAICLGPEIESSPAFTISWLNFMASQYDLSVRQVLDSSEDDIKEYYYRNFSDYIVPATVTVNELHVINSKARDSVRERLQKGYKLITAAHDLVTKRRREDVNFIANREISEKDGSVLFRSASKMQIAQVHLVPFGNDRFSFIELIAKKERRHLPFDEAASAVRSDLLKSLQRAKYLNEKASLLRRVRMVIHYAG